MMEATRNYRDRRAGGTAAMLARAAPLGGVLVVAAILGLLRAGDQSLWRDEGFSVLLARAPWGEFGHVVVETQANMALYYVLLKAWLTFGDGEAVLRSLSALAAVGAVAATYGFAARLFGRAVGLVAALLLALNALLVQYAQEVRGYALVTFLVALACLFYVRGAEGGRARDWVAYALVMSLAVYAHLFAAFVLLAHAVTIAVLPRSVWTRAAVAVVAAGALAAPVALAAVAGDAGQINWISTPTLSTLFEVSRALAGGTRTLLLVYAALGLLALISAARADIAWKPLLVTSAAALPVAVPFALSFAKPMLVDRFAIVALPAIVTLVALGIVRLRRPLFVGAALAAAVAASAVGVGKYFAHVEKEDFRAATAYVLDHTHEGDGIIFYRPTRRVPFEYYLRWHPGALPDPLYPTASWGDFDLVADYRSEGPSMPVLAEELSRRRTVWLFLGERLRTAARERTLAEIIALVEEGRVVAETRRYPGIEVRRYEPSR
jgi:mannosyltransferase